MEIHYRDVSYIDRGCFRFAFRAMLTIHLLQKTTFPEDVSRFFAQPTLLLAESYVLFCSVLSDTPLFFHSQGEIRQLSSEFQPVHFSLILSVPEKHSRLSFVQQVLLPWPHFQFHPVYLAQQYPVLQSTL